VKSSIQARSARQPTFYWQGLLIILPAILLAGAGFFSLRQDRVLAYHEATEQARKLATDLAQTLLPNALGTEVPTLEAISSFRAAPKSPEDDPILKLARSDAAAIACLVDEQHDLKYPPALPPWPVPQALDITELDEGQRKLWQAVRKAAWSDEDLGLTATLCLQFLASEPPQPFAALASYHLALLLLQQNEFQQAWQILATLVSRSDEIADETGFSLRSYAGLQLLEMAFQLPLPELQRVRLLSSVYSREVLEPSALSSFLLDQAAAWEKTANAVEGIPNPPSVSDAIERQPGDSRVRQRLLSDRWNEVWQAHVSARMLHAQFRAALSQNTLPGLRNSQSQWLTFPDGQVFLVRLHAGPDGGDQWVLAQTESATWQRIKEVVASQRFPEYFQVGVEIAGKPMARVVGMPQLLASSDAETTDTRPVPAFRVSIHLTDPLALYARQRVRTFWFGSLIALASLAVFIGFLTAWRAFQRQQWLSEMKTNFVSSVSHELRTPIASVRLMAEELEDIGPQNRQKNKEYHRFIVQECRRLSALIENVLDFSRHEQGRQQYDFEPTDMAALVRETAKLMQAYALDKQVVIETVLQGEPVSIDADGRALQQVLVNLMDNAIKHSPAHSSIEVGLEFRPDRILLWVEDHGEGIPPAEHERIFERFYRRGSELRRETQGVGLGLAIVKFVTEAHAGKVIVRSDVGQGSRFVVELPIQAHQKPERRGGGRTEIR
jgi:signal transduction histidine kinase